MVKPATIVQMSGLSQSLRWSSCDMSSSLTSSNFQPLSWGQPLPRGRGDGVGAGRGAGAEPSVTR